MHSASIQVNTGQERPNHRKKKIPLAEREWALPAVEWSQQRPKPKITPGIWENEVEEELAKYIEWHGRHPHCVTPRKMVRDEKGNELIAMGGKVMRDDLNPDLYYTDNGINIKQLSSAHLYKPNNLGKDGDIDEVSKLASKVEYSEVLEQMAKSDDAWYTMSVKDQLEQSHIDGDHTTVKTRKKKVRKELSEFEENRLFQQISFGDYQGGFPKLNKNQLDILQEAAVHERNVIVNDMFMKKRTPFQDDFVFSKYTINGTALNEFKKIEHNYRVEQAIKQYEIDTEKLKQELIEKAKQERKDFRLLQRLSKKEKKKVEAKIEEKIRKRITKDLKLSGKIVPYNEIDSASENHSHSSSITSATQNIPKLPLPSTQEMTVVEPIQETLSDVSSIHESDDEAKHENEQEKQEEEQKEEEEQQELQLEEFQPPMIEESMKPKTPKLDPIIKQRMKLGGDETIDEMVENLLKLSVQVNKKAKVKANFNLSVDMDILEACEKLRVMKVLAILVAGGDANKTTEDDELLFNICFERALRMDNISGDKYLEDESRPQTKDIIGSDRDKLQKILDILVRYKAEINSDQCRESMSPIHLAVLADNVKMVRWLAEKGAKIDQFCDKNRRAKDLRRQEVNKYKKEKGLSQTPRRFKVEEDDDDDNDSNYNDNESITNRNSNNKHGMSSPGKEAENVAMMTLQDPKNPYYHDDHMTPLMIAAKLGHIACLVELIRYCDESINLNAQNPISGMTCLHYAAMYGQTRIALFLLRIGADKKIKDKQNRTAAQLAADINFPSTAQAISAFAVLPKKVAPQLRYTLEQQRLQSAERRRRRQGLITLDPNMLQQLTRKPRFPAFHYLHQQCNQFLGDVKHRILQIIQPKKTKYTDEQIADLEQVKKMHSESRGFVMSRLRQIMVTKKPTEIIQPADKGKPATRGSSRESSNNHNQEGLSGKKKTNSHNKMSQKDIDPLTRSSQKYDPIRSNATTPDDTNHRRKERRKKKKSKENPSSDDDQPIKNERPISRQERLTKATFG